MNAVVIFDVTIGEALNVIKNMRLLGYATYWECAVKKYNLPHNAVWKPNTEIEQAKTDLQNAIDQLNLFRVSNAIKLSKCIVLNSTPWAGIPDEYASIAG